MSIIAKCKKKKENEKVFFSYHLSKYEFSKLHFSRLEENMFKFFPPKDKNIRKSILDKSVHCVNNRNKSPNDVILQKCSFSHKITPSEQTSRSPEKHGNFRHI